MRLPRFMRVARYRWIQRRLAAPRILAAFAERYPEAFFVEIGSNDGDHHDHLRPFILTRPWRGIMVEPVPYIFERLRSNYGHIDRLRLVNAAVGECDGEAEFFHLREADPEERQNLPDWYDGTGSFSREMLLKHAEEIPNLEERIVSEKVQCLTYETLCARHGVADVDLLLVDTEGYDWELLRRIELSPGSRPRLIVYEHFHLSPADRAAARNHFGAAGYETLEEGFDTFCLDPLPDDDLTRRWRRMKPAVKGVAAYEVN